MGSTFGDKILSNFISDQCDMEVQVAENHQLFVQDNANRPHQIQTSFSEALTRFQPNTPTSPSTRQKWECDANLTSFDFNKRSERQATLRKLSCDLEAKYSQDVPVLLNILKSFYPFNETSGDVLEDYEINDFFELYGISDVRPILASNDNYVFWLENTTGIIYMWSRVDSTMSYLGGELREALVNYLFHQENICYVIEFTHELIPENEIEQKARELADSFKSIGEWVVTKGSNSAIRNEQKGTKKGKNKGTKKGKNKGKKKKKKH
ncbi:hypothetical protein GLOIN_2v1497169 [Rhizophagus irregularis DAOM 181602=DAOM 197198]|uniref:Uncharacterized protein n=1 Tax=Rhizophagus irregularis (strain DAOM 181602 / DAOM 197198 / MUCL 43194) TaxID=747089 RepID=A0A2P4QYK2_RHIID|nr:hypothetical protein GLOIN_2v1497169 [Rhizophagus irregularis DAOM 181602=DAOM 197198]POG82675.1 hypothetical protein GLOIN_2v1497169 [Rhizophagus irregularis DAOM 181602=DAOM 197198]|eukprot:XP_025189541.1 hypothetical protein GLOIN_2v1497169 [Rhizophagus irregularis DAOM 181602=DAOM 197198]